MAGKSWQPSHEPPHRKGKKASATPNKQWKEGGKGWGKLPLQVHALSTRKNASNEERMEFRRMRICKKPLATRER